MPPPRSSKKSSQRIKEAIRGQPKFVVPLIFEDAPLGTYHIDELADELLALGFTPNDRAKLIATIRLEIYFAADIAVVQYKNDRYSEPLRFRKIKRFFRDTAQIEKLIRRNEGLDITDIVLATTRLDLSRDSVEWMSERLNAIISAGEKFLGERRPSRTLKEIEDLLVALSTTAEAIKKFQENNRPTGNPGNRDPLTQQFIDGIFEYWCEHLSIGGNPDEDKLFLRFLSAAWRDVQFPTKDHKGQPLEDWLADRVRKRFREGVCAARLQNQSEELYDAWVFSRPLTPRKKSTK
jgi:hypothetical protein